MIEDISNRMLRDFAACLQAKLADEQAAAEPEANGAGVIPSPAPPPAEPAAPISATSVLGGVLVERLRSSPAAIAALFAAIGALVVLLGRRLRR